MRRVREDGPGMSRGCLALLLVVASALVTGCANFGVRSDWDAARLFPPAPRLYLEVPEEVDPANPFADNTLLRNRIEAAIRGVAAERGFVLAQDRETADFVMTYQVLLEDRYNVDGTSAGFGGGWGWRPIGFGGSVSTHSRVRQVQEATLLIDFLAPASDELVWRGWGEGMLTTRDRTRSDERLRKGVEAILGAYPPR